MKLKIYYLTLLCLALFGFKANAQVVTISPAKFTAEDEITITIDVNGFAKLSGVEPLYIWAWSNAGDAPNGAWDNSAETAKMTKVSTNVWKFTMIASTYYGKTPAELKTLGFLIKAKSGAGDIKTGDFGPYNFDPLTFSESQFRSFPAKAMQDDVVTIYHTNSLAPTEDVQRMNTVTTVTLTAFDAAGVQIGVPATRNVDSYAGGLATCGIVPSKVFTVPANKKIIKITAVFNGKGLNAAGSLIDVSSNTGEIFLFELQ